MLVVQRQVSAEFEIAEGNIGKSAGLGIKRASDLPAGGVTMRMQDTGAAVRSFASEGQLGAVAVKSCAPVDQLLDALRPLFHQYSGGLGIAQTVAGIERILQMQPNIIFVAQGYGDAALGVLSSRFAELPFGQHQHASGFSQLNGGAQTGNAGSHDDEIGLSGNGFHGWRLSTTATLDGSMQGVSV